LTASLPPLTRFHHAGREASLLDQLEDAVLDDRVLLGRLRMKVFCRSPDGVRPEPERDHERGS
jgi:hypothetical protein